MSNKTTHTIRRKPIMALVVIALIAALSISAYAIVRLLSPAQVAREVGDDTLAQAFEDGKGTLINESVTSQGYIFTLIGMTNGKNLSDFAPELETEQTAMVFAVQREDGTPINAENGMPFVSGAFFSGYRPWMFSSFMLGAGGSSLEKDGVFYMVLHIDESIEMLADHTVTYGIWHTDLGIAPGSKLLTMQENGTIVFNENLQGAHAMFTLPLDAAKADPARVAQVLEEMGFSAQDVQLMQSPVTQQEAAPPAAQEDVILSSEDGTSRPDA